MPDSEPVKHPSANYILTESVRAQLQQELSTLYKDKVLLQQSLRKQQNETEAAQESLLLELLEIGDALEALLAHLETHHELEPVFLKRLPRLLGATYRKLMDILERRGVTSLEVSDEQFDYHICKAVDREIRSDLPEQTIIKVLKRGFSYSEKVLRPIEVITSTQGNPGSDVVEMNIDS